uniref:PLASMODESMATA CALLOSE-BINDING PROTEIN 3-like n=1 Tax=Erigeron canadensis TaxID=72917 RepID=UPI001CB973EA|nr:PLASMODESMATA CALLOSE-BINDING PROTEIN 3-like [Erigeron canadensis]
MLYQLMVLVVLYGRTTAATWCVVRSDASREALQVALDYACGAGADCAPIQQTGLCFLPNTIQAHASYAFNSYYMRTSMAPGACDFAGTATIAKTDPSYGSCNYPASPSAAGGTPIPGSGGATTTVTPSSNITPLPPSTIAPLFGRGGGLNSIGMVPTLDTSSNVKTFPEFSIINIIILNIILLVSKL